MSWRGQGETAGIAMGDTSATGLVTPCTAAARCQSSRVQTPAVCQGRMCFLFLAAGKHVLSHMMDTGCAGSSKAAPGIKNTGNV